MQSRRAGVLGVGLALFSLAGACSSDDGGSAAPTGYTKPPPPPSATLNVNVNFPNDTSQQRTLSVHAWALGSRIAGGATCSALVSGELDPYDGSLERRADVAGQPGAPLTAEGVTLGAALVYVEALGFDGVPELAGCVSVDVVEPSTDATVTLTRAGVADCADPATENGAPCDDGKLCTVGEACSNGSCGGGVARDCTHVADSCSAESCDETLGCVPVPLPDKTPCDDALFCTDGDVCMMGACVGVAKDCSVGAPPCKVAAACSESSQSCVYSNAPFGTACDDGLYCTENDSCSSSGTCNGSARDCSMVADQCNTASCDDASDTCVPVPRSSVYTCSDGLSCTLSDRCDGSGSCGAGTPRDCSSFDDQCNLGACGEPAGTCSKQPRMDGTPCDDGSAATSNDICTAGVCAGT